MRIPNPHGEHRAKVAVVALALLIFMVAAPAGAGKFYADDPLLEDDDRLDTPEKPAEIELSDLYDRFSHIFSDVGSTPIGSEAENVNTLDEVPNSSWFTNRHGTVRMNIDELTRGPNQSDGPDPTGTWEVFKSKSQGLTPGFQVTDGKGDRYVIKLDPIHVPRLSSAAEVIATKIFYAIGYSVPENYIVYVDPANFTIKPGTTVTDRVGDKVPLTEEGLQRLLRRVPRLPDGRIRVTASKYIPGRPIGPFRYHGTRSDDPNDIILHEQRRELRGLRLIAAWLNHDDTRAHNTQDTWVEEDGRHYVRHFLIDFGSTFGSGSIDWQYPHLSFHYWMDLDLIRKNTLGFGFHVPTYRKVEWPDLSTFAAVGRWESNWFEPGEWKNDYPNPAFVRMTARDAFWAAKTIMRFTPEELRAIVGTGELGDEAQEEYFLKTLLERQRKCGQYGLSALNPLAEFAVSNGELRFENLSEKYEFASGDTRYRVEWSVYDNGQDTVRSLGVAPSIVSEPRLVLPAVGQLAGPGDTFLVAEIYSLNDEFPRWDTPVGVYLRPAGDSYEVAGIERKP